jgi:hypothetical protein
MTIVHAVLLVLLLAALIRIPIPSAGKWQDVFGYLLVILVLLIALLTKLL